MMSDRQCKRHWLTLYKDRCRRGAVIKVSDTDDIWIVSEKDVTWRKRSGGKSLEQSGNKFQSGTKMRRRVGRDRQCPALEIT
jgi:hypothetical protein